MRHIKELKGEKQDTTWGEVSKVRENNKLMVSEGWRVNDEGKQRG